ncbi:MAG TPA: Hsp70 family protein [Pseudonocardiaceae bacterium]
MVGYSLGVDLGTTVIAAAVARGSRAQTCHLGDRSPLMPAVLYVDQLGTMLTGEPASRRGLIDPDRMARYVKRQLGDPTPVLLGGQPHSVPYLLNTLLRGVVHTVTELEGEPPERIVLAHPGNWSPLRRARFEEVARIPGFHDTVTISAPEAAAEHYTASRHLDDGTLVAVYDLGGGALDVALLRRCAGGFEYVGAPTGIERLGGIDFDEAIIEFVNYASGGALNGLDMADPRTSRALAQLREDCTAAKEALSTDTDTILPVYLADRNIEVHITRADFENLIRAGIESSVGALQQALRSARVAPTELAAVLLLGGSSRIPLVARMVSEALGCPVPVDPRPKAAVALGAAVAHLAPDSTRHAPAGRAESGQHAYQWPVPPSPPRPSVPPLPPAPSDPHDDQKTEEADWQTTSIWPRLVTGVAVLAAFVVITLVVVALVIRLR